MKHLIILHGALGSKQQFLEIEKRLSAHYQVHLLNFSGHGGDECDQPFTMDLFCDDVLVFMNRNNIAKACFFGFSMGGYVAIEFVILNPEKVEGIFTLGTVFDWSVEKSQKETSMLIPEKVAVKVPAFALELQNRHAPASWEKVMIKTADMILELGQSHLEDADFKKLLCRVRIALGDGDNMAGLSASAHVFKQITNGSLLVIPETPHAIEKVNHERLKFELIDFFK